MRHISKVMESLALTGFEGNVFWLRYNPDALQVDGETQHARTMPEYAEDKREEWLIQRLQQISQGPPQTEKLVIDYTYPTMTWTLPSQSPSPWWCTRTRVTTGPSRNVLPSPPDAWR